MKKKMRKIIALILIFTMILPYAAMNGFAANGDSDCIISVTDAAARPGSTVSVDVLVENNPGIQGATLTVTWDAGLTLKRKAQNGPAFSALGLTAPTRLASPYNLVWYAQELEAEDIKDGVIATLEFEVSAQAKDGDRLAVSISYIYGDVLDVNKQFLSPQMKNGVVSVSTYTPGNVNNDQRINALDLIDLSQYIADGCTTDPESYNVAINPNAGDVDNSGRLNALDLILISQYIADGCTTDPDSYNVKLVPSAHDFGHTHSMQAVAYKASTCTVDGNIAYWYCTDCHKYFSNAAGTTEIALENTVIGAHGHVEEIIPETDTMTEGKKCSVCQTILVAPQEKESNQFSVTYNIAGNDAYLAGLTIENPNPTRFNANTGINWLEDLEVSGYNFEGWFDGQGSVASRITSIPAGTARNIRLYAKWTKEVYTITFDNSSMSKAGSSMTYTVDQKVTLEKPTIDRYVFLGWTTDADELVSEIKPGTTGNFTLHSNWTSKRNLAKPVAKLGDPIIVEDTNEGRILFAYEIGQLENVPLYTIKNLPSAGGVVSVYTETTTNSISKTDATTIAKAVDHVTTDSTAWTLSEDWNATTHVEDSVLEEHGYNTTTGQEIGRTSSNTYTLTTNEYDNTVVKTNDGTVATTTQYDTNEVDTRETWESTASLSVSDTQSSKYTDSAKVSAEVGVGYGPVSAKVGASMETSTEISSSSTAGASEEVKIAHENTSHSKTGTDTVTVEDNTTTTTNDKGWNKSESSSSTSSSSFTQYEEQTLSESIAKAYTYGQSYASGGANSRTSDSTTSSGESNTYSTTVTYFTSEETTEGVSYSINGENDGSYRLVRAGIVHVFAVVIYDIANAEYSVATYGMLDDETYTYIDYSATSAALFDDNENGVLPFEVPYFVSDYVNGRIAASEGLEINNVTGSTGSYTGSNTSVVIPEYISVDNMDNTHSAVTVRGLSADTFRGKTNIKSVLLSNYIREIPAYAFAGCTALQFVLGSEIGSIGSYAFDGCTDLGTFKVSSTVDAIGENAFRGVDSIEVTASSLNVIMGAIQSGAKHITINLSEIDEEMLANVTLEIPDTVETFVLEGGRKTYHGLKIVSDAGTTVLNGITIVDSTSVPLTISSENITLNQVTVNAPNYVLLLKSNAPTIELYGTSAFNSAAENAVVCRNVTFMEIKSNIVAQLEVCGNVLCCGTPVNATLLKFPARGEIILLTADDYEKFIQGSVVITLDANDGAVETDSITAYIGAAIGDLPTPVRDHYSFDGWYDTNGNKTTADTVFNGDETLTAKWLPVPYTVSWNTGTGYGISVSRTGSPNAGAALGTLSSGATVYYGDVLSVTYTVAAGYSITANGKSSVTVTGNVTSNDIYATASANSYTYDVVYRSSNGTALGSTTVTKVYGTTNTVTAPGYAGYATPASQSVTWDTAGKKTITFTYYPNGVGTQSVGSGWWWSDNNTGLQYSSSVSFSNRTANSVVVTITWTNTIKKYAFFGFAQYITVAVGGGSGSTSYASSTFYNGGSTVSSDRSESRTISFTVGSLSATQTSVGYSVSTSASGNASYPGSWSGTLTIPAY